MKISFTKMHGCGNDYIYIDCTENEIENPNQLSAVMSPRHFSVGSDGLVLICASQICDFKMRMFNLDGSEGNMCGNAIRCVGKYVYDCGLTDKTQLTIETKSGIKYLSLTATDGKVKQVTVNMGKASLEPKALPVIADKPLIGAPVTVNGRTYSITAISMGNPHQVIFCDSPKELELTKIGPDFENSPIFPERVNTEFVRVNERNSLFMRVWERGSGETYACGTGACASAVASVLGGYCDFDTPIKVALIGGELSITVKSDMTVYMTGPAEKVYDGIYELD